MKQQGSAHAFIIIGLIFVIIGLLSFMFWQNFIYEETTKTSEAAPDSKVSDSQSEEKADETDYSFQDAVDDIRKIVSNEACNGSGTTDESIDLVGIADDAMFTGKNVVNNGLTHSYVTYGCGSQGVVALLKKEADSWKLLNEDARVYPMCDVVRGEGFPSSVVDMCYENDSASEPIKI